MLSIFVWQGVHHQAADSDHFWNGSGKGTEGDEKRLACGTARPAGHRIMRCQFAIKARRGGIRLVRNIRRGNLYFTASEEWL